MDHRMKIKEEKKKNKYMDLARELKHFLENMKVTVIPIITGVLEAFPIDLVRELEKLEIVARSETIQNTTLLK